jgi:MurNAc alpha-1-phosphate uridylyltransferase
VNGDVFCDYPFAQARLPVGRDTHLVLVPNPPQHPAGDFGLERGLALADAPVRHTFSGIAAYRREFFAGCTGGAFPLKPLLIRAMGAGRCSAELYRGSWEDVGTKERLEALNGPPAGSPVTG